MGTASTLRRTGVGQLTTTTSSRALRTRAMVALGAQIQRLRVIATTHRHIRRRRVTARDRGIDRELFDQENSSTKTCLTIFYHHRHPKRHSSTAQA